MQRLLSYFKEMADSHEEMWKNVTNTTEYNDALARYHRAKYESYMDAYSKTQQLIDTNTINWK